MVRYGYISAAHHLLDALRVAMLPIAVFLVVLSTSTPTRGASLAVAQRHNNLTALAAPLTASSEHPPDPARPATVAARASVAAT
jgi:hypothetical protein